MKRFLVILAALLLFTAGAASAAVERSRDFVIRDGVLVEYRGPGGEVTVPEGVTELGKAAFQLSAVTKVNLPGTLKKIDTYCFFQCEELEEITLPASLEDIEDYHDWSCYTVQAFAYNRKLPAINVAEGNRRYISVDGVLFTADGKRLLYYPDGKVPENGVYSIPEGTEEIGDSAFGDPAGMRVMEVPASVTNLPRIGYYLGIIGALQEIRVSPDHERCCSVNGNLYDRETNTLLAYPAGKPAERLGKGDFPQGILAIGDGAFTDNRHLKTVEFPEGITYVGWSCLKGAESLESVTVPASVEEIGNYAFLYCYNLEQVTILNPDLVLPNNGLLVSADTGKQVVLRGYEGSTTQAYAEKWHLGFESLGAIPELYQEDDFSGEL